MRNDNVVKSLNHVCVFYGDNVSLDFHESVEYEQVLSENIIYHFDCFRFCTEFFLFGNCSIGFVYHSGIPTFWVNENVRVLVPIFHFFVYCDSDIFHQLIRIKSYHFFLVKDICVRTMFCYYL